MNIQCALTTIITLIQLNSLSKPGVAKDYNKLTQTTIEMHEKQYTSQPQAHAVFGIY